MGYALRVRGQSRADVAARVEDLLRVVRLDGLGGRRPDELSGGQQQRVALARALSVRPRVLLLDEPLSNLDANLRVLMREEIKRLQRELRLTVAYVTHDQEEAMSISDRIAVILRPRWPGPKVSRRGTWEPAKRHPDPPGVRPGVAGFPEGGAPATDHAPRRRTAGPAPTHGSCLPG